MYRKERYDSSRERALRRVSPRRRSRSPTFNYRENKSPPRYRYSRRSKSPHYSGRRSPPTRTLRNSPSFVRNRSPQRFSRGNNHSHTLQIRWSPPRSPTRRRSRSKSPHYLKNRSPRLYLRNRSPKNYLRTRSPKHYLRTRSPQHYLRTRSPQHHHLRTRWSPPRFSRSKSPQHYLRNESPQHYLRNESPQYYLRSPSPPYIFKRGTPPLLSLRSNSPQYYSRNETSPYMFETRKSPPLFTRRNRSPQQHSQRNKSPPLYQRISRTPSPNPRFDPSPNYQVRNGGWPYYWELENQEDPVDDCYNNGQDHYDNKHQLSNSWSSPADSPRFAAHGSDSGIRDVKETDRYSPSLSIPNSIQEPKDFKFQVPNLKFQIKSLEEIDKLTPDQIQRYRISGATKKKITALVEQGTPYIDAKRTIMKQNFFRTLNELKGGSNKRSTADSTQESKQTTLQLSDDKPNPDMITSTSEDPNSNKKRRNTQIFGVAHVGYPEVHLPPKKLNKIQAAIMSAYEKLPKESHVRLKKYLQRSGHLLVTCANTYSADWLREIVPQIKPWEGAKLTILIQKKLDKVVKCKVFIPDECGVQLTVERVINRLRVHNKGLNTDLWMPLGRFSAEKGQVWFFAMNLESFEMLKKRSMRAHFGFGTVIFRFKGDVTTLVSETNSS